jgi:TATA-box binding protein (TBP) (component of TFIID and TFIIIB)
MLPVVIYPLPGCVIDTVHFSRLITKIKRAKKIFIVFTHIENLITGAKHLIREDNEDASGEELQNLIIERIEGTVNNFIKRVREILP